MTLTLVPGALTLERLQALHAGTVDIALDDSAWATVAASAATVALAAEGEAAVYGVNTGFGKLAFSNVRFNVTASNEGPPHYPLCR